MKFKYLKNSDEESTTTIIIIYTSAKVPKVLYLFFLWNEDKLKGLV